MQNAKRLGLAMLLLSAAFLVLVGIAAASLWAAGQVATALLMGVIGALGAAAAAITWRVAQADEAELPEEASETPLAPPAIRSEPVRIQTMPVADLPPAYLEAVLRGAHARLAALKAQSPHPSIPCK
jgi:hypothetical protein